MSLAVAAVPVDSCDNGVMASPAGRRSTLACHGFRGAAIRISCDKRYSRTNLAAFRSTLAVPVEFLTEEQERPTASNVGWTLGIADQARVLARRQQS